MCKKMTGYGQKTLVLWPMQRIAKVSTCFLLCRFYQPKKDMTLGLIIFFMSAICRELSILGLSHRIGGVIAVAQLAFVSLRSSFTRED